MLVVTRYRVPVPDGPAFADRARDALAALAACPGYAGGRLGRAVDDPRLWVLASDWSSVGDYRRALGGYEVKLRATPVLAEALDEPTAFETVLSDGAAPRADGIALADDHDVVAPGDARGWPGR